MDTTTLGAVDLSAANIFHTAIVAIVSTFFAIIGEKYLMPILPERPTWRVFLWVLLGFAAMAICFLQLSLWWLTPVGGVFVLLSVWGLYKRATNKIAAKRPEEPGYLPNQRGASTPDMAVWDAINYILTETEYGRGQFWSEIEWDLLDTMRQRRINLWVRQSHDGNLFNYTQSSKSFGDLLRDVRPDDFMLNIPQDQSPSIVRTGISKYDCLYDPRVCREEIKIEFNHQRKLDGSEHDENVRDWPAVYAMKYICNDTIEGANLTWREVETKLTQLAADGKIQVWSMNNDIYVKVETSVFGNKAFRLHPESFWGRICGPDYDDGSFGSVGECYYVPMLSRAEVKRVFPPIKAKPSTHQT